MRVSVCTFLENSGLRIKVCNVHCFFLHLLWRLVSWEPIYTNRAVSIFSGADLDNWILDFDFYFFDFYFFKSATAPSPTPINSSQTDGFEAFFGI